MLIFVLLYNSFALFSYLLTYKPKTEVLSMVGCWLTFFPANKAL